MGLFNVLKQWHDETEASIAGEDAAKEWYRQGGFDPPSEGTLESMASEIAPGYEESFTEGFEDRWNEGVEAAQMNTWQRFWHSKGTL